MLLIPDLRSYIDSLKAFFPEIERSEVVIDDSQLTKFLQDVPDDGKFQVVGLIPKHNPFGNIDIAQSRDRSTILLLKKVDRSSQTHNNFLDAFAEAQELVRKVVLKMGADKMSETCGIMEYLDFDSLDMDAIWQLASCDGYKIDFSLKTHL